VVGLLFPQVPALVAREADGFVLVESSGMRAQVRGGICKDIQASLEARCATPELARLGVAHHALQRLTAWLATPAVPLTHGAAVELDGFDTLFVELLGQCNERCVHCYAESSPTVMDALEPEVVFSIVEQAAAAGFRRVQFTGGDPLLCDFLPEAVARAHAAGIPHIEIYTNGLALSDELADKLAPYRPAFAFSVYSVDPDVHDRTTRTPGSHRRTLAAIDRVVARGLECRAAAVVLEPGQDIDALVETLTARGVGFVSWSRAFAVGRGTDVADASQSIAVEETGQRKPAETGGHRAPTSGRSASGKLCITYSGDVVPCIFQRKSVLGNVRDGRTLAEIVTTGARASARRGLPTVADTQQRLQCASCRLTDVALAWLGTRGR
jgi:AdoMet-dependent heme synthase